MDYTSVQQSSEMYIVWTPETRPPHPSTISPFSTEAELVWRAICAKHEEEKQRRNRQTHTGLSYYQSMYNRAFKCNSSTGVLDHPPTDRNVSQLGRNAMSQIGQSYSQTPSCYNSRSQATQDHGNRYENLHSVPSYSQNSSDVQSRFNYNTPYFNRNPSTCNTSMKRNISSESQRPYLDDKNSWLQNDSDQTFQNRQISNLHGKKETTSTHTSKSFGTSIFTDDTPTTAISDDGDNLIMENSQSFLTQTPLSDNLVKNVGPAKFHAEPVGCFEHRAGVSDEPTRLYDQQVEIYGQPIHLDDQPMMVEDQLGSPPLDMDNDMILSQLPKLPTLLDESLDELDDQGHQPVKEQTLDGKYPVSDTYQKETGDLIPLFQKDQHFVNNDIGWSNHDNITDQIVGQDITPSYSNESNDVGSGFCESSKSSGYPSDLPNRRHLFTTENASSTTESMGTSILTTKLSGKELTNDHTYNEGGSCKGNNVDLRLNDGNDGSIAITTPKIGNEPTRTTSMISRPQSSTPTSTLSSRLKAMKNSFDATSNWHDNVSGDNAKRPMKQSKFAVPLKKSKATNKTCSRGDENTQQVSPRLVQVDQLSSEDRRQLCEQLTQADEVALTLIYSDGTSQLRELVDMKRKGNAPEPKAVSLAVAYPVTGSTTSLKYVSCSLPKSSKDESQHSTDTAQWIRSMVGTVMKSKARKLIFDAQELIETLMLTFQFDHKEVIQEWSVLDAKIAGWLLDPDQPPMTFTQVLKTTPHYKQTETNASSDVCDDLDLLGPVMLHLYHQLKPQGLWMLYTTVEMPLSPILACMQHRGLMIDTDAMVQAGDWMKKKLKQLEKEAFKAAGHSFVINSHAQLRQVIFEELRLDEKLPRRSKIARTASNLHKSTSETVLTQLSDVHPLPALILEYRQIQKVKSTYVDGLLPCVVDSMLHTHWEQTSAVTGRLTSTNPNIQAIPKQPLVLRHVRDNYVIGQKDVPVEILSREPFIANEGWSFVAAGEQFSRAGYFQQVELRLLAHLSADPSLLAIFKPGESDDIFIQLASQWLMKPEVQVTSADREQTKRVVYSVMYGAGKERLAEYMKIAPDDAKAIMKSFTVKFPGINSFTRKCVAEARDKGYLRTILGRRRWFPQINHSNPGLRAQAERQAVNFCIQGSAADLCKAAMIQVEHSLAAQSQLNARLLVQIHDELLIEVRDDEIHKVTDVLRGIMENCQGLCGSTVNLLVPLTVSFSQGKSWGHMKPYSKPDNIKTVQSST